MKTWTAFNSHCITTGYSLPNNIVRYILCLIKSPLTVRQLLYKNILHLGTTVLCFL